MGDLQSIAIRNFKAFRDSPPLMLDGRHLLLYGANGSGKSSLYWALHTFLESGEKTQEQLQKYFDPNHKESLVNIYAEPLDTTAASIKVTVKDDSGSDLPLEISHTEHQTAKHPTITKARLASDFITYRFFFKFSNFRNSETFDIWPLFEREILPFCVSTGVGASPQEMWNQIKSGVPNPSGARGLGGSYAYDRFQTDTAAFATRIDEIVNSINRKTQEFYDDKRSGFASDDVEKVDLRLRLTTPPAYDRAMKQFTRPVIEFGVQIGGKTIAKPQTFLNEAKLTQIAISIRLAASLVNLNQSSLKLLVLDDLLVSLDMSNRMKVVEIILSDTFAKYQKIILTHDRGFFQETRRHIGADHGNWFFGRCTGSAKEGCRIESAKSDLEMAQDYLANDQLEKCGNRLRKHAEANLESFLERAHAKKGLDLLIERGAFSSLGTRINEAKGLLVLAGHEQFAELLHGEFSAEELAALASPDEIDPTKFSTLSNKDKGKLIAKLYAAKPKLQQEIIQLLADATRKRLNAIRLLDDLHAIKDRILNPASHSGKAPLYTKEAKDAVKVLQALEVALNNALATLSP